MEETPTARGNVLPYQDRVNTVTIEDTFQWLAAGWRDFIASGTVSVAYGLVFVIAGLALTVGLYFAGYEYLIPPLIEGFLLLGPALTVGFQAISRDMEAGRKPSFTRAITAWRANPISLLGLGLMMLIFLVVWVRLAVITFALTFPYTSFDLKSMINAILFTQQGYIFLALGTAIGAVLATLAFMGGVVSLPMMLDRKTGILESVVTSFVAVATNFRTMLFWAAIIVVVTGAGLATAFVGLAIALPLIGHASWHAYRALIKQDA